MIFPAQIRTVRLVLRKPVPEDAAPLFAAMTSDAEVTRYLSWTPDNSPAQTRATLGTFAANWPNPAQAPTQDPAHEQVYIITRDKAPIGTFGLRPAGHELSFGYALGRAAWGQGLMTEILRDVISLAFTNPDLHRVYAYCDTENIGSIRVMEKAGMRREGTLRRHLRLPAFGPIPRDSHLYAAIRPDPAVMT